MRDTPAEGVTFRKSCARYIENINRGIDYISILNNHSMKSKPIEIVSEDLFVFFFDVFLFGGEAEACLYLCFLFCLASAACSPLRPPLRICLFCFLYRGATPGSAQKGYQDVRG
jgi:hypothetical protein